MRLLPLRRPLRLLPLALLLVGACAAPPVSYYSLATTPLVPSVPMVPAAAAIAGAGNPAPAVHLEVAPVGVPERLARPQMVIRSPPADGVTGAGTRVEVLEQQRWTSSFDSELRDAFAVAIADRAGALDVTRGGRLPGHPVYRIAIRVNHFDAVLDQQLNAGFGWTITRSDDSRNAVCATDVAQPAGSGMNALVQAVQQAVARVAEQIALQVAQLEADGTARCAASGATQARSSIFSSAQARPEAR
jgi:uncharacterized lipoprotein YmbA